MPKFTVRLKEETCFSLVLDAECAEDHEDGDEPDHDLDQIVGDVGQCVDTLVISIRSDVSGRRLGTLKSEFLQNLAGSDQRAVATVDQFLEADSGRAAKHQDSDLGQNHDDDDPKRRDSDVPEP